MNHLSELLLSIPDTRPYPETTTKNELLRHAAEIASETSNAQRKLAHGQLSANVREMLEQNHYLSLSVALSMVQSPAQYRALWQTLCDALSAQKEGEIQWLAFPLILVIGAEHAGNLNTAVPLAAVKNILATHPVWQAAAHAQWLPNLVSADTLSQIPAGEWFSAKANHTAAARFGERFQAAFLPYAAGQKVELAYALCYGDAALRDVAGRNLGDAALPLMQAWQESLGSEGLTLFVNPLGGEVPAAAQVSGSVMRQRMACDVFTANAVRSIRLQQPRVGVLIAARQGGELVYSFQANDNTADLPPLNFVRPLAPGEEVPVVVQHFLDLLSECHIEHVRVLHDVLPAEEDPPFYNKALQQAGFNPFFIG